MQWRQFFTPVQSMDSEQARAYIADNPPERITILDVRQPREYEEGHLPGARLIPLTELNERFAEIDPRKPTVVYCASGNRSRIASQMLVAKGFEAVYNLTGGMHAWNGHTAIGEPTLGLAVFSGAISTRQSLLVAYSMEQGLRDFYLSILPEVSRDAVRGLFEKLADIEILHQRRVFDEYRRRVDPHVSLATFESETVRDVTEGGLTTEQYLALYQPDLDSPADVIAMAMSIEAQALDLYQRAAQNAREAESRDVLLAIAAEEQVHLRELGKLMDRL